MLGRLDELPRGSLVVGDVSLYLLAEALEFIKPVCLLAPVSLCLHLLAVR